MVNWRRWLIFITLLIILVVVAFEVWQDWSRYRTLKNGLNGLEEQLEELSSSTDALAEDIDYYSDPYNLEKELRSRFNYKEPGEELMIIVPKPKEN